MAFQGSLDELPLPDIIQLVAVSGKTGAFELRRGQRSGEILLRDGQIVHALSGQLRGEEALYELATWPEGEFKFTQGKETDEHTIDKSNTNLLMEAARRMDEWKILAKRIPSTAHVPVFRTTDAGTSVSFSPHEWQIVSRIDGRQSIEDISIAIGRSPFDTCKHLYGLLTSGLIELRENLFRPLPERLAGGRVESLQAMVDDLHRIAAGLVQDAAATDQLAARHIRARNDLESGRGVEAVIELVHFHEEKLGAAAGETAVSRYLEQVQGLLREGPRPVSEVASS